MSKIILLGSEEASLAQPLPVAHTHGQSRRGFLTSAGKAVIGLVGGIAISDFSWAAPGDATTQQGWQKALLNRPRVLTLRRGGEILKPSDSLYWQPVAGNPMGRFDVAAYKRICWFLRDTKDRNQSVSMSIDLLNIMVGLQNWLLYYGYDPTTDVTSAYRTAARNSRIEGAARNSWHTRGGAIDFYHRKLDQSVLGKMAVMWADGGVGFYPGKHFTHVDPGKIRSWRG